MSRLRFWLPDCVMVAQQSLNLFVMVRIHVGQPLTGTEIFEKITHAALLVAYPVVYPAHTLATHATNTRYPAGSAKQTL